MVTSEVRKKFGLVAGEKVILISAGSLGIGLPEKFLESAVNQAQAKVLVVCGKNEAIKERLSQKYGNSAIVLGYYAPMEELYAIADIS